MQYIQSIVLVFTFSPRHQSSFINSFLSSHNQAFPEIDLGLAGSNAGITMAA